MVAAIEKPSSRISEEKIRQAKSVSIMRLVDLLPPLHQVSRQEWAGPCPKCGGDDRFHCQNKWFFCRQCHPETADVIEFVIWRDGREFREAVELLTGSISLAAKPVLRPPATPTAGLTHIWRKEANDMVERAQALLYASEGTPAQEYLYSRGLEPDTWMLFDIGFRQATPLPGTWDSKKKRYIYPPQPAIVIPWFSRNGLTAIRHRFLQWHEYGDVDGRMRREKQTAQPGSKFAGMVFGPQRLVGNTDPLRWLLICEGEINAMSCWQAAKERYLHVLSIGSQSAHLSKDIKEYAQRYKQVFVWADEERTAQELRTAIPGAVAIKSPKGMDANDLLQKGVLGGFLAAKREMVAQNEQDRSDLFEALYRAAKHPLGIDTESAMVLKRLAAQINKKVEIYEPDSNRWITP